jgi:ParB family transcriptional regulator, chromosome partitioning protein
MNAPATRAPAVTGSKVDMMRFLLANPGQAGVAPIARALGRDTSNAIKTLNKLSAEGLVTDAAPYSLTEAGVAACALFPQLVAVVARAHGVRPPDRQAQGMMGLLHAQISPHPLNPRKDFDQTELEELRDSIIDRGAVLQNLVVRPADAPGHYWIVAGERRWRAVGMAIAEFEFPLDYPIPCWVDPLIDEGDHLKIAIAENLQRVDLKPLEEAQAFEDLAMGGDRLTNEQIAVMVRKSLRHVQVRRQLLTLPAEVKEQVAAGALNLTEARKLVEKHKAPKPAPKPAKPEPAAEPEMFGDPVANIVGAGVAATAPATAAEIVSQASQNVVEAVEAILGDMPGVTVQRVVIDGVDVSLPADPKGHGKTSIADLMKLAAADEATDAAAIEADKAADAEAFDDPDPDAARALEIAQQAAVDHVHLTRLTNAVEDIMALMRGGGGYGWPGEFVDHDLAARAIVALSVGSAATAIALMAHLLARAGNMGLGEKLALALRDYKAG